MRVMVVGSGVFGAAAALALRHRRHEVTLLDPGPIPHPLAESTDITKAVRLDYGADDTYLSLMEGALFGWRQWNTEMPRPLFHETGVLFVAQGPMEPGTFEHASFVRLQARGHAVERLDAGALARRFPAWSTGRYVDGYFNPLGGYAESGAVVAWIVEKARRAGVTVRGGVPVRAVIERGGRVNRVGLADGTTEEADVVVVAAGAWTPSLVPWLRDSFHAVGQPVFHLVPTDPTLFAADRFPVFGADISRTGWYGFPLTREGVVKVANHGPGRPMEPGDAAARVVTAEETAALRTFLGETFPALAEAPVAHSRVCVYGDTWDEHFWIAPDPERPGLVVAAGGSGHGFKFAPVLGGLVADAVEGVRNPYLPKFRWRPEVRPARGEEEARGRG